MSASEHAGDMVLVAKPMCWGMQNHLGLFSEASNRPEGQELGRRSRRTSRSEIASEQVSLRLLKMVPNDSPYSKSKL